LFLAFFIDHQTGEERSYESAMVLHFLGPYNTKVAVFAKKMVKIFY
jgi:hypothetical protein